MTIKLFEIRDAGTTMPVMAVRLSGRTEVESWLLERAGFGREQMQPMLSPDFEPYIVMVRLDGVAAQYDPFAWGRSRTLFNAHAHMISQWDALLSGDVIDVEYLLGERTAPKLSERLRT